MIDGALNDFLHRELVSSNEITDILLDVRTLLRKSGEDGSLDEQVPAQA